MIALESLVFGGECCLIGAGAIETATAAQGYE